MRVMETANYLSAYTALRLRSGRLSTSEGDEHFIVTDFVVKLLRLTPPNPL
jgi:hypothetical protein